MGNNSNTRGERALERLSELILLNDIEIRHELIKSLHKFYFTLQDIHPYDFVSVDDVFKIENNASIKNVTYEEFIELCIVKKIISKQHKSNLLANEIFKNKYTSTVRKYISLIEIDNDFEILDSFDSTYKEADKKIKILVLAIFKEYERNNEDNLYLVYFKLSKLISSNLKHNSIINNSNFDYENPQIEEPPTDFINFQNYLTIKHLNFIDEFMQAVAISFTEEIDRLIPNNANYIEAKNAYLAITTFREFYLNIGSVRKMTDNLTDNLIKMNPSEIIINIICMEFNVTYKTVQYTYFRKLDILTPKKAELSYCKETHLVKDMSSHLEEFENLILKLKASDMKIHVRTYNEKKYSVDFKSCTSVYFYKTKFNEPSKHIFHINDIKQSCIYIDLDISSSIEEIFKLFQIIFAKHCSSIYFENYVIKLFPLSDSIAEKILTSLSTEKLLNM